VIVRAAPASIRYTLLALLACGHAAAPAAAQHVVDDDVSTEYQRMRLERLVDGVRNPWAVAVLHDGRLLVSERRGRLLLVDGAARTEVQGVPGALHAQGQGGLLDVVPHPDAASGWIYFTWSRGDSTATVTALSRARLDGTRLVDVEHLFTANSPERPGMHYGSRVVFLEDGTLLLSIGDRGREPARAQDPRDHSGSVLRLNADGTVPADNPFVGNAGYAPEIFSYGHRNIQGMVRHPVTGEAWATEHGPRGSDLLHRLEPGRNYGWPGATRGRDYRTQEPFGDEPANGGRHAEPVLEFIATLAPSGLAVVRGGGWAGAWQGNLLAGGLRSERIMRLVIEDGSVVHAEELLLGRIGRIRDVRRGPDGLIYIVTDEEDGGVYRIVPRQDG
jgi:aldose sugar dehydrogenase